MEQINIETAAKTSSSVGREPNMDKVPRSMKTREKENVGPLTVVTDEKEWRKTSKHKVCDEIQRLNEFCKRKVAEQKTEPDEQSIENQRRPSRQEQEEEDEKSVDSSLSSNFDQLVDDVFDIPCTQPIRSPSWSPKIVAEIKAKNSGGARDELSKLKIVMDRLRQLAAKAGFVINEIAESTKKTTAALEQYTARFPDVPKTYRLDHGCTQEEVQHLESIVDQLHSCADYTSSLLKEIEEDVVANKTDSASISIESAKEIQPKLKLDAATNTSPERDRKITRPAPCLKFQPDDPLCEVCHYKEEDHKTSDQFLIREYQKMIEDQENYDKKRLEEHMSNDH